MSRMVEMCEYVIDIVTKRPMAQLVNKGEDGRSLLSECLECLDQLVRLKDPGT